MASLQTAGGTVSGSAQEIIVTAAAGVAVVVVLYWLVKREIKAGAGALGDALAEGGKKVVAAAQVVNPASDENFVYQGSNWFLNAFTPYEDATVGTAYADAADTLGAVNDKISEKIGDSVDWLRSVF